MKFMKTIALVAVLFCAAFGTAQTYSTNLFSVGFNGTPTVSTTRNQANTSTRTDYRVWDGTVLEQVLVVNIDHTIPVDYTSSDFYRDEDASAGEVLSTANNSQGMYQGRPFSYGCFLSTFNGADEIRMTRYIIVNATTAIFISMELPDAATYPRDTNNAFKGWEDFESSLNIK